MSRVHLSHTTCIFLFCCFCQLLVGVTSLKCLQCSSYKNEPCFSGTAPATECPDKNFTYCLTYSGFVKETRVHLLFRNCTQNNLTNECHNFTLNATDLIPPGSKLRVCYFTCQTDGCNTDFHGSASSLTDSHLRRLSVLSGFFLFFITFGSY